MPRPKLHDAELRHRLLERTAQMVADGGIGALSLRSLAAAEATSTTAVYSLFGGKPALLAALHERGFELFAQAQSRSVSDVATDEPLGGLRAIGRSSWRWALTNPHLYLVMFDPALQEYISDPQRAVGDSAFRPLRSWIVRAIDAGDLEGDPEVIAFALWSNLHGAVSLLLSGHGPTDERSRESLLEQLLSAGLRSWGA